MGEELRGKGAGHRPSSLHEELLQFIIDEWAQIPKEVRQYFCGIIRSFFTISKIFFQSCVAAVTFSLIILLLHNISTQMEQKKVLVLFRGKLHARPVLGKRKGVLNREVL